MLDWLRRALHKPRVYVRTWNDKTEQFEKQILFPGDQIILDAKTQVNFKNDVTTIMRKIYVVTKGNGDVDVKVDLIMPWTEPTETEKKILSFRRRVGFK